MKPTLKKLIIVAIIASVLGVFYMVNRPKVVNIPDLYQPQALGQLISSDFIPSSRGVLGMQSVAETNFLELFLNENTSHFAVVDKRNNTFWTSNFTVSDPSATLTFRNMQRSTFTISYRDIDNTTRLWTNFDYSINAKNFVIDYESVENGFRIDYTLADTTPKGYWFPTKISRERYQTLVLDRFDNYDFSGDTEKDRNEYLYYYRNAYVPSQNDPDVYVLGIVSGDNTSSNLVGVDVGYMFEYMYEIGLYGNVFDDDGNPTGEYSFDDVNFDNEEHGYDLEIRDPEFKIPLIVQLKEDHLHTEILTSDIEAREPFEVVSIRMLPYLGATRTFDDGYMVIPEGSGGLMYLNNGKSRQRSYSTHFYEADLRVIPNQLTISDVGAHMPIFGTKKANTAILGIITEGAEHATLTTEVSGKNDMFNKSFVEFRLKDSGLYYLTQSGIPIWHTESYPYHPTIKYYLLADEDATYTGMANLYGKYLESIYDLELKASHSPALFLDILGSYDFEDYFLFFPYKNTRALTTYKEALSMVQSLETLGVDQMIVNYIGWFNKGIDHESPDRIALDRVLGSKQSFNTFNQYLLEQGHQGYFDVDFIKYYDSPSVFTNRDISRVVGGTLAEFYPYDIASRLPDETKDPYYLLKVGAIHDNTQSFLKSFDKLSAEGISLRNFGTLMYSDFHNQSATHRYEIADYYQDILFEMAQKNAIMLQNPNAFLLPFVSHISDLSIDTSHFLMVDQSIPFYQLAIAGKIDYAMPSINLDQVYDLDYYLLKAIETGSHPKFTISFKSPNVLINTKYNRYFSTEFARIADQIGDITNRYQALPSAQAYLVSHEIIDQHQVRVTYSNGTSYVLNYQTLTYES